MGVVGGCDWCGGCGGRVWMVGVVGMDTATHVHSINYQHNEKNTHTKKTYLQWIVRY